MGYPYFFRDIPGHGYPNFFRDIPYGDIVIDINRDIPISLFLVLSYLYRDIPNIEIFIRILLSGISHFEYRDTLSNILDNIPCRISLIISLMISHPQERDMVGGISYVISTSRHRDSPAFAWNVPYLS